MKTHHLASLIILPVLALGLLPSCTTTRDARLFSTNEKPPDLAQIVKNEPSAHVYQIRGFHFRHVWAGNEGYPAAIPYRALITLFSKGGGAVAELYFHDAGQKLPNNTNPTQEAVKQPYQIHFPLSTMDTILQELRTARQPVYLVYYHPANENQWAVGVLNTEDQPGYNRP